MKTHKTHKQEPTAATQPEIARDGDQLLIRLPADIAEMVHILSLMRKHERHEYDRIIAEIEEARSIWRN